MDALPVLIVVWAVVTGLFLALLAYNGTITRYEESQLFLADINMNEQQRQTTIVRRVNRTLPFVRILGTVSGINRSHYFYLHLGFLVEAAVASFGSGSLRDVRAVAGCR